MVKRPNKLFSCGEQPTCERELDQMFASGAKKEIQLKFKILNWAMIYKGLQQLPTLNIS